MSKGIAVATQGVAVTTTNVAGDASPLSSQFEYDDLVVIAC